MGRNRTVKNVSFADTDYENGLLDYATKPEHGPFSVYVKRLIEQDRAGVVKVPQASLPRHNVPTQKDRSAALDLL